MKFYTNQTSNAQFVDDIKRLYSGKESPNSTLWHAFCSAANRTDADFKAQWRNEMVMKEFDPNSESHPLTLAYQQNQIVMPRFGCVESTYINCLQLGVHCGDGLEAKAKAMSTNAGLFAANRKRMPEVLRWYVEHSLQLIRRASPMGSCFAFLAFDLPLWASAGYRGPFVNWGDFGLIDTVFRHSEGKKVLFLGQATGSIALGYRNLHRYYRYRELHDVLRACAPDDVQNCRGARGWRPV